MIIGISGKINSGKDLIGDIIQYLIDMKSDPTSKLSFDDWLLCHDSFRKESCTGWQIRKFADKLKEIICLLIGCTREQLEDRVFKDTVLGEEWWYCQYDRNGQLINYKDALDGAEVTKLTPRLLLQLLGTQCGRQIIHPNIWVNSLFAEYKEYHSYASISMLSTNTEKVYLQNWIITDVRFYNEVQAIKDKGGIVIRVNRPSWIKDQEKQILKEQWNHEIKEHESETALDNWYFPHVISNDGSIEDLVEKVRTILISEKIIS